MHACESHVCGVEYNVRRRTRTVLACTSAWLGIVDALALLTSVAAIILIAFQMYTCHGWICATNEPGGAKRLPTDFVAMALIVLAPGVIMGSMGLHILRRRHQGQCCCLALRSQVLATDLVLPTPSCRS